MRMNDYVDKSDDFNLSIIRVPKKFFLSTSKDAVETIVSSRKRASLRDTLVKSLLSKYGADDIEISSDNKPALVVFNSPKESPVLRLEKEEGDKFFYSVNDKLANNGLLRFSVEKDISVMLNLPGKVDVCDYGVLVKSTYLDNKDFVEISETEYNTLLGKSGEKARHVYLSVPSNHDELGAALAAHCLKQRIPSFSPAVYARGVGHTPDNLFFETFCLSFLTSWATELWVDVTDDSWKEDTLTRKELAAAQRIGLELMYVGTVDNAKPAEGVSLEIPD